MQSLVGFLALASATVSAGAVPEPQQYIFSNPPSHEQSTFKIPSVHESAVMARRIQHLTTIGTLVTSFPTSQTSSLNESAEDELHTQENRPQGVENSPIGLMEYYADCEPYSGNPTILALSISTPFRNYQAGSNISLSLRWWPEQTSSYSSSDFSFFNNEDENEEDEEIPSPHTPAALPRFSLHGYLEPIPQEDMEKHDIAKCFVHAHPDSRWWQPGNRIHEARYMRLVVEHVYWLGGFGDRARIQWLPIEEWRNVTMEEVASIRLPGEKKKKKHKSSWFQGWKIGL